MRFRKIQGAVDGDWTTVFGPKVPILKGTAVSLSYVPGFLYLVSSSINISIFLLHGWIPSGQTPYIQAHILVHFIHIETYLNLAMFLEGEFDVGVLAALEGAWLFVSRSWVKVNHYFGTKKKQM